MRDNHCTLEFISLIQQSTEIKQKKTIVFIQKSF